jgi:hypothetical protein
LPGYLQQSHGSAELARPGFHDAMDLHSGGIEKAIFGIYEWTDENEKDKNWSIPET